MYDTDNNTNNKKISINSLKSAGNLVCIDDLSFALQYLIHKFSEVVTTATDQLLRRYLHVTHQSATGGASDRAAFESGRVLFGRVNCKTRINNFYTKFQSQLLHTICYAQLGDVFK